MNWNDILGDVFITLGEAFGVYLCYNFGKFWTKDKNETPLTSYLSAIGVGLFVASVIIGKLNPSFIKVSLIVSLPLLIGMYVGIRTNKKNINGTSSLNE